MMIFKIMISLTTGHGQFRLPLLYCLRPQLGSSLWIPGNFTRARFLANPIMAPSIKTALSLVSYLFFLHLYYHIPLSFLNLPFLRSSSSFLLPSIPLPEAPNFVRRSCMFPISRWVYICFSLGSPYYLAYLGLRTISSKSFIYSQYTLMSEYLPYSFFLRLFYLTRDSVF